MIAPRRRATALRCTVALATVLASAGRLPGQENQQPLHTFFAPVEVPLVSVEAFVSDRQGRPVPGLGSDDFEVFEDGQAVAISHFYAAPGVAEPAVAEPASPDGAPTAADPAQDLYLVIYLDDTNLARGRRQAALDHLRGFLASELPAGLKVMLVRYDGHLQVDQVFTDDLAEVTEALANVQASASLSRELEESRILREIDSAVTAATLAGQHASDVLLSSGSSVLQEINSYVDQTVQRVRTSLANQERFIRSLSGLSGRKAMLLVSDGVEARVGERLYSAWGAAFESVPAFSIEARSAFLRAARNDLGDEFAQLAREANAHRVSLYTLSGLGTGQARATSAENRFMDDEGLTIQQATSADVLMANTAGTTGGRTLVNSPALGDQLEEVAEELASYYSLAFEPTHVGDGKYHKLEVKVRRDGIKVRHREGYLDVPQSDRLDNRTLAAAVHGVGDNPMEISVERGEVLTREDGSLLVPIIIMVPIGQLVLVPEEEEHQGHITILLTVRDEHGGISPTQQRQYPVPVRNLDLPTALNQSAGFTLRLAVSPGRQRVAVGVRDDIARTESVATLEIDVSTTEG